jgi:hypothetical protein
MVDILKQTNKLDNNIELVAPVVAPIAPVVAPIAPVVAPIAPVVVSIDTHLTILWKSISNNYIFFLVLLFCLYKFHQNKKYTSSYIQLIVSFITISILGHLSHYVSHHINCMELYGTMDNMLTRNKYINKIITIYLGILDFHNTTHHDTSVNKQLCNIFYEFISNIFIQGIGIVIFIKMIDIRVILLWAFMYATIHNINYLYFNPTTHRDHHLHCHTNFGIDFVDILLNTKYDWNDIEIHNHGAINLLVITYIIMYFTK